MKTLSREYLIRHILSIDEGTKEEGGIMVESIKRIIEGVGNIYSGVYSLLAYALSGFLAIALIYLLVIRPIRKAITDKGSRWYWLSVLFLVAFGFGGPILIFKLGKPFGTPGYLIGIGIYAIVIMLAAGPGMKKESKEFWSDIEK